MSRFCSKAFCYNFNKSLLLLVQHFKLQFMRSLCYLCLKPYNLLNIYFSDIYFFSQCTDIIYEVQLKHSTNISKAFVQTVTYNSSRPGRFTAAAGILVK